MRVAQFSNRLWKNPLLLVVILATWQSRCSEKMEYWQLLSANQKFSSCNVWMISLSFTVVSKLNLINESFRSLLERAQNFTVCSCCDNPRFFGFDGLACVSEQIGLHLLQQKIASPLTVLILLPCNFWSPSTWPLVFRSSPKMLSSRVLSECEKSRFCLNSIGYGWDSSACPSARRW